MKRLPGFKAGAPFLVYADFQLHGQPELFPSSELRSQVRDRAGRLIAELQIEADAQVPGRHWLSASDTALWPAGDAYFDIRRLGSATPYTETIAVPVELPQTRPGDVLPLPMGDAAQVGPTGPATLALFGAQAAVARVVLGVPGIMRTVVVAQVQAIPRGVPGVGGAAARKILAAEALSPGDLVHLFIAGGVHQVRRASALLGFDAHAFVRTACAAGAQADVYGINDDNDAAGVLVPGVQWLSTVSGKAQASAPQRLPGVRVLVQRVGIAYAPSSFRFLPGEVLRLAPAIS